jgi:hypothetical protein
MRRERLDIGVTPVPTSRIQHHAFDGNGFNGNVFDGNVFDGNVFKGNFPGATSHRARRCDLS